MLVPHQHWYKMKIIVSHDVDHLFGRDHWLRDLIYPKLWVRETISLLRGRIPFKEWFFRCISCFKHKRNYVPELIQFDKTHGIKSTFFFGMNQGLGMSYKPIEAKEMIHFVREQGFDAGVHGICFDDLAGIEKERHTFTNLMGFEPAGIRMHYVRFNESTFQLLNKNGYSFDSTEFDKREGLCVKAPYKVGSMWEFPLCVMDSYLPYNLQQAKDITMEALQTANNKQIEYFTILFHDTHYGKEYSVYKEWYEWLIKYAEKQKIEFISFSDAIKELN